MTDTLIERVKNIGIGAWLIYFTIISLEGLFAQITWIDTLLFEYQVVAAILSIPVSIVIAFAGGFGSLLIFVGMYPNNLPHLSKEMMVC